MMHSSIIEIPRLSPGGINTPNITKIQRVIKNTIFDPLFKNKYIRGKKGNRYVVKKIELSPINKMVKSFKPLFDLKSNR